MSYLFLFSDYLLKVKVLVAQSCPTLCNPVDCSPLGSSFHGISQARILEWVVIPFSRGSSQTRDQTQVSCIAGRFPPGKPTYYLLTFWISLFSFANYVLCLKLSAAFFFFFLLLTFFHKAYLALCSQILQIPTWV